MLIDHNPDLFNERSLMLVRADGKLDQVTVPFRAICNRRIGIFPIGTAVDVEGVSNHGYYRMLYHVSNHWIPYFCFDLAIER